ncbi:tyrosine--tRNA ligase [bacterium]|nr:MAG: tyrosine--tRNA ligase [bacterium]
MATNVFDVLEERGFIQQTTNTEKIKELLGSEAVTFYIGFDPTADSLHVGHYLQLVVMAHMQQHGHKPIVLLGGGTTMVGDPTGKTDMRKMMTKETIAENAECFKKQISNFVDFGEDKATMVNNADWLLKLNYIDFLRDIGVHFSVNRMLTADCFKSRLEGKGLTFIEFNYMLMQSYDFLVLNQENNCKLQLGGDDQWSNIIYGIDLIRRKTGEEAYGMTFTLLTNSEGKKMGKTEKGAVWLDPEKTTPYEFYQYWRNVEDTDVARCLALLTFLPMDQVAELGRLQGAEINKAKAVLAYEVTKLVHGEAEASKAQDAAAVLFGGGSSAANTNVPSFEVEASRFEEGVRIADLLVESGLTPSKSEARRAIEQGGVLVNDIKVTDVHAVVTKTDLNEGSIMIQRGKKSYCRIVAI